MTLFALVAKNLMRQPVRTALTVLGISVGITTVVALGVLVSGLKSTTGQILRAYSADFLVARKGAADLSLSTVTEREADEVARRPDVDHTIRALMDITQVGDNPFFVTMGVRPQDLALAPPKLLDGTLLRVDAPDDILLGDGAAAALRAMVGDTVELQKRPFHVVGIYHIGNTYQDNGAMAPLAAVQEVSGKANTVTGIYVIAKEGIDPVQVAQNIRDSSPLLTTVANISEVSRVDQGIVLMDALDLAITALAVGIGAIGVMNTMVMSVFERTREIGILRAVGWRGSRIMRMIVGESLILCLVATVAGSLLGVLASRAVLLIPAVRSVITPEYPVSVFVRALAVAIVVALVGAAYPAIRAVRLQPMEALRHE